ncbi:MAG: hypothetical protein ACJARG_001498, partial [Arcticibacterium sp.]
TQEFNKLPRVNPEDSFSGKEDVSDKNIMHKFL